jgi:hypothetical protein
MYQARRLKPLVSPAYVPADATKAHIDLGSRRIAGKLILSGGLGAYFRCVSAARERTNDRYVAA